MELLALRDEAARRIKIADHMLTMTYPLVKDPKLLLAVLENIEKSMHANMERILQYERARKQIPPYPSTYEGRFTILTKLAQRHSISKEVLRTMSEMREVLKEHRASPIEFRRQEKFVICTESYKIRTLTPEDVKRYIQVAKTFAQQVNTNDRLTP